MNGSPCKARVKKELSRLNILYDSVEIGVIKLPQLVSLKKRRQLKSNLKSHGIKLHEDKKGLLIEKIKETIHEMIQYADGEQVMNHSTYLSLHLNYDYTYLANIFSEVNGICIQQYIIQSKIEKVKELIIADDLNLSEISFALRYSSVAHLSSQFKKITGLSPTCYKNICMRRESLTTATLL